MTTIQVSEEVRDFIEDHSRFPEATHDVVLQRLFGIEVKSKSPKKKRRVGRAARKRGQITPQKAYELPILKVLLAAEGYRLSVKEVKQGVKPQMDLTPMDRERLKSGRIRWEDRVEWARWKLVKRGLVCPKERAGRGNWELTIRGVREAKELS